MAAFTVEDKVGVKFTTLEGTVKGASLDNTTLEIQYLVEYIDRDGEPQQRYFKEADLQSVV